MRRFFKGNEQSTVLWLLLLGVCVVWALWPVLCSMANRWTSDPRYAHGYLVPIFSLILLGMRYGRLDGVGFRPSTWGLVGIVLGATLQLAGGYYRIQSVEGLSLVFYVGGLTLLVGGWRILECAWPSIAFLVFMVPLPWSVESALGPPLQFIATVSSTYVLQTLGFMAFAEGNVIRLNDAQIGVEEACSGLSMLISFVALSTAAAMVVKRPLLDRIVLIASSVPVALVANIARITVTAILHDKFGGQVAFTFYHDIAGWVMIPLALLLYWFEIWILSHLLIENERASPGALDLAGGPNRPINTVPTVTKRYKPSAL
jgi:exosortase